MKFRDLTAAITPTLCCCQNWDCINSGARTLWVCSTLEVIGRRDSESIGGGLTSLNMTQSLPTTTRHLTATSALTLFGATTFSTLTGETSKCWCSFQMTSTTPRLKTPPERRSTALKENFNTI